MEITLMFQILWVVLFIALVDLVVLEIVVGDPGVEGRGGGGGDQTSTSHGGRGGK